MNIVHLMVFKMKIFWIIFTILLGFGCVGCGSTAPHSEIKNGSKLSVFEHINPEEKSQAIVYLYRPSKFNAKGATPWVTLNGDNAILLGNSQYTRLVVRPGNHVIQTELSDNWISGEPDTVKISARKGAIYFLKITPQTTEWNFPENWLSTSICFIFGSSCMKQFTPKNIFKIEQMEKSSAIPEIQKTSYVPPSQDL